MHLTHKFTRKWTHKKWELLMSTWFLKWNFVGCFRCWTAGERAATSTVQWHVFAPFFFCCCWRSKQMSNSNRLQEEKRLIATIANNQPKSKENEKKKSRLGRDREKALCNNWKSIVDSRFTTRESTNDSIKKKRANRSESSNILGAL